MADFGKLNFAVAFVPQTAFPLDGRTYFESLEAAQAAAAIAVPVGSSDGVYHYGMELFVVENGVSAGYRIQPDKTLTKVDGISAEDLVGEF
ncbi:hypothetical protein HMPREF0995_01914 [Lachnospiraceae bacterium 7_1_58FAA]|jgi:hypothetical protein|nr:hypothetical protein HMPREF0995_01914 [Lachnospiraceae bacterium 7_1_58FAA]